jgi:PAS domain S-box-containing protein
MQAAVPDFATPDLRRILDSAPDIIAVFDPALRHVYVNPAVERVTGRASADFIGKTNAELGMPPASVALWDAAIRRVFDEGATQEIEFDYESPAGRRSYHARIVPCRDAGDGVALAIAITRDISGARAVRLVDAAIRHLPLAMAIIEAPGGRVLFANAECERIFGQATAAEQMDEYERYRAFHEDGRPVGPEDWPGSRSVLRGEVVADEKLRVVRPDGTEVVVRATSAPVLAPDGTIMAGIVTFHDVTRHERNERDQAFLAKASLLLSDALDASTTLQALAKLAVPAMADWCVIHLLDDDGKPYMVSQEHIDPAKLATARVMEERYPAGENPNASTYRILHGGPAELEENISAALLAEVVESDEQLQAAVAAGLRSGMAAPIQGRTARLGVITFVTAETRRHYTRADLAVAEELGRRAGLAVENARLYERERAARRAAERAVERTQRLQLLGQALAQAIEAEHVAATLVQAGKAALGVQTGIAWLLDESEGVLALAASEGPVSAWVTDHPRIPLDRPLPICDAMRSGQPVLIENAADLARRYALVVESRLYESWAILPLVVGDRSVGAVTFCSAEERRFAPEEYTLLAAMCSQTSLALERCRLFAAERQARAQAEALYRSVKESEERARLADRRKDEFLAMLGHELRNPLAPITTALELMRMKGDARTREREIIERQVSHLTRLIDDLLDVSRITRGKIQLDRERVDVASAIAKAVETVSPLLEKRAHRLELDVPRAGLLVEADPVRLVQIIQNLLMNAAKYTEPQGHIVVAARPEGGQVRVSVTDNGIGIPADVLPNVFDLFVQGERALDRAQGGLGIGLTLVKQLVELHGGSVEARSEGPGRGSEFVVRLPQAEPVPAAPERAAEPQPRPRAADGRRVLVVDDNPDAAETIADMLRALGHEVAVAHDGPSALDAARRFQPEAALLDLGLPVMDGYELAQHMRRDGSLHGILLIAVTGYGQENDRARAAAAGFDRHLVKPVNVMEIHRLLAAGARRVPRTREGTRMADG